MDAIEAAARAPLTFSEMEARIRALPEVREDVFRPGWFVQGASAVMSVGMLLGLTPSFLLTTGIPHSVLLRATQWGLILAVAGFVPVAIYYIIWIAKDIRGWVKDQARRMDHQKAQFAEEIKWLQRHPSAELESMLDYVRYSDVRRAGRIGLIAGSVEKLGVLPVLVSLFVLFRGGGDPFAVSGWVAALGVLLSVFWLICWIATLARGRLRTYEFLLEAALKAPGVPPTGDDGAYFSTRPALLLSVQRALLGEVHPQLWRVSIEGDSDQRRVHIRFEYEGAPTPDALECGSIVATEVLANLPGSWDLLDEYVQRNPDNPLPPLAHLAFQAGCV